MYQIASTISKTFSRIHRIAGNEFTYNVPQGQYVLPAIPHVLVHHSSSAAVATSDRIPNTMKYPVLYLVQVVSCVLECIGTIKAMHIIEDVML
jgi:hypothetical protein